MFPRPLACLLFLASADYSAVLPDFIIALGGLSKTGFALVVRVELDGDCGLVLIGLLLACFAGLEKHGVVLSSLGLLACHRCLYILYGRRAPALASFPIYGDENTISGLAGLAVLLAWCSCVGRRRLVCRPVVLPVGRRSCPVVVCGVVVIGPSLSVACLSHAHRLGLRLWAGRWWRGFCFAFLRVS